MQRIIKFRAWNKETQKMCEEESLASWLSTEMNNGIAMGRVNMEQEHYDNREDFIAHLEVMQYTERKDENGKDGYFDDLVEWGNSVYQIMWNYEEGIAQLIKCSGGEPWSRLPIKELANGNIIGNIYENPELLETK